MAGVSHRRDSGREPASSPVVATAGGWLRRWPTLLVAAYTLAALVWSMPPELFPPKRWIEPLTVRPFMAFSLWQAWDMFSPDPRRDDVRVEVIVTARDGTRDRRVLTDMPAMGFVERWRKDRWRKYFNDHLRLDAERALWQPYAEYAARRCRAEGRDPAAVELIRWWRPGELPIRPGLRADERPTPWQGYRFHEWHVPPWWGG